MKHNTPEDTSFFGSNVCGLTTSKFAPSSQKLLNNINKQNPSAKINEDKLIKEIHSYLESNGGQATSQQLIQHFKPQLPSNSSILFKKMLQEIAIFKKKEGIWEIKTSFI